MKKVFITLLTFVSVLFSCDSDSAVAESSTYDSASLLLNIADEHIVPEYEAFSSELEKLKTASDAFVLSKTEENLQALRGALTEAYSSFQPVAKYGIGLAESTSFYANMNTFPLDESDTQINISTYETVDLTSVLSQDTQGFPALDFLINGLANTDTDILAFYTGDTGANYSGYLIKVIDRMQSLNTAILDDWKTTYRDEFVANTGSAVTESVNVFVNAYVFYLERRLRSAKVGIPAGALTTDVFPNNIESLYNPELSKSLLQDALSSTEALYVGSTTASTSLSTILIDLGNTELDTIIKERFSNAATVIDGLNDNLKEQVETDNDKMLAARDALQSIVTRMKVDMVSALSLSITFADNDGD